MQRRGGKGERGGEEEKGREGGRGREGECEGEERITVCSRIRARYA